MEGAVEIVVADNRVVCLRAEPPFAAKVTGGPGSAVVHLVGSAAGLLRGDVVTVSVRLGPGSMLAVHTVAATLAHPVHGGPGTRFDVEAHVADDAHLTWWPEPLVACAGCDHRGATRIELASTGVAIWVEELVLGRSGETAGPVATTLTARHAGRALLRDGIDTSQPGATGPAVLGSVRYLGAVHVLGRRPHVSPSSDPGPARTSTIRAQSTGAVLSESVFDLAGPGATARVVTRDIATGRRRIGAVARAWSGRG